MLNEDVDLGVIKVTKDKNVSKVILGWVEGLLLVTVMMIVIVEVVGEVMVIIDVVDNQYTARGVHKGEGGARRISYCICLFCKFVCSFSNFPSSIPTDHQTVDGKVPAIPHYVQNCATTNLVGGWIWICSKSTIFVLKSPAFVWIWQIKMQTAAKAADTESLGR